MKPLPTLALCLTLACLPAYAADEPSQLKDVPQLIRSGKLDEATRLVDKALAANPKNAAARFQRSAVLTARGKPDEAIAILLELTAEYPELPEPYNNLAVLYAARGRYDDAKWALESAIRADPVNASALAEENLGDVYLKLADIEFEKASKLDPKNQALRTKRNSLQGLLTTAAPAPATPPSPQPASR
jgi:Flp pilus assembly protein TadD